MRGRERSDDMKQQSPAEIHQGHQVTVVPSESCIRRLEKQLTSQRNIGQIKNGDIKFLHS